MPEFLTSGAIPAESLAIAAQNPILVVLLSVVGALLMIIQNA